jgi:thiamine-phosphate pyrophosphorylase
MQALVKNRRSFSRIPEGIYGITSNAYGMDNVGSARMLLEAGIKVLQYREKKAGLDAKLAECRLIRNLCSAAGAMFIVNDDIELARLSGADGIHLGQKDMPLVEAKRRLGRWLEGKEIGISVANVGQSEKAIEEGATYLGAGAVFPNNTKEDSEVIGLEGLADIMGFVKGNKPDVPVVAIGGIKYEHIKEMKTRYMVHGIAVISGILNSKDPIAEARRYSAAWDSF